MDPEVDFEESNDTDSDVESFDECPKKDLELNSDTDSEEEIFDECLTSWKNFLGHVDEEITKSNAILQERT